MKIAATGDNHLNEKATVAGKLVLGPDGRSIRAADRERCLMAVADGAVGHAVDVALNSGDLFDSARPTPAEYVIAEAYVDRICRAGIPLVIVADQHGLPQSPLEAHALAPLIGRHENLYVLLRPEVITVETHAGPLQIAGLPWPRRSMLAAKEEAATLSPEALNALISEKLGLIVHALLAQRTPGIPCILLGHVMLREAIFSNDGTAPDTGQIILSAEAFAAFDAAVLGDIHRAQSFGPEGRIFYAGSTDRVKADEEHEPKGWWLVKMEGARAGGYCFEKELIETPARRYCTLTPDELIHSEPYPEIVYRIKTKITQEEYEALAPHLARWREATPLFAEQVEISRQTRARSEEMRGDLDPETNLKLWHQVNERPEDFGELLEAHREIAGMAK